MSREQDVAARVAAVLAAAGIGTGPHKQREYSWNQMLPGESRREYLRRYQREWMARRRRAWIESQGGRCCMCGSSGRLEVDHVDPSQKITHRVWSLTQEKREIELAKCQVLCRSCHQRKTSKQRRGAA